jgi:radical SAM protein with 4Fe4S-binding SPASM domain
MRGIELLLERGLRLNLKSILLKANRHELDAMIALAERLGVRFRFDGMLWPRLDGGQEALAQRLSPAEVVALDHEYPERQQEFADLARRTSREPVRAERVYACGAGRHTFHIDCAGRLSVCMMSRQPGYDLLSGGFQDGWQTALAAELTKTRTLDTPCRNCTVNSLCTQCPGWSQAAHGDDESLVEYVCEIGRLRAAQVIPEAIACPG